MGGRWWWWGGEHYTQPFPLHTVMLHATGACYAHTAWDGCRRGRVQHSTEGHSTHAPITNNMWSLQRLERGTIGVHPAASNYNATKPHARR
jgi:hypothetical protein